MSNIFARQKNRFLLTKGNSRTNFSYRVLSEDFHKKKCTIYLLFSSEQKETQPLFTTTLSYKSPNHTLPFPSAKRPTCLLHGQDGPCHPLSLHLCCTEICSAWQSLAAWTKLDLILIKKKKKNKEPPCANCFDTPVSFNTLIELIKQTTTKTTNLVNCISLVLQLNFAASPPKYLKIQGVFTWRHA